MDLSKLSNEELMKIAKISPKFAGEVSKKILLASSEEGGVQVPNPAPNKELIIKKKEELMHSDFDSSNFMIELIEPKMTYEWMMYKHYAHKIPPVIKYCYGLFKNKQLVGVCVYGILANKEYNNGKCLFKNYRVDVLELKRLVVDDDLPKNTLSYFVSKTLKMLPQPTCVVSYADSNQNHHGYIYQATNWLYTGMGRGKLAIIDKSTGEEIHEKTIYDRYGTNNIEILKTKFDFDTKILKGKYRYLKFIGNHKQKKEMLHSLKWKLFPYPKGDNINYDASYKIKNLNINKKGIIQEKREEDRQTEKQEEER